MRLNGTSSNQNVFFDFNITAYSDCHFLAFNGSDPSNFSIDFDDRLISLTKLRQIDLTYRVGYEPVILNMSEYFCIIQSNSTYTYSFEGIIN